MMAQSAGDAYSDALRIDFDHCLKLEFHYSSVTSDTVCQLHSDASVARGGREMVAYQPAGKFVNIAAKVVRHARYAFFHMLRSPCRKNCLSISCG